MTFNSTYNEGDILWTIEKNKVCTGVVSGVAFMYNTWMDKKTSEHYWIKREVDGGVPALYKSLDELFPTREELIKSLG